MPDHDAVDGLAILGINALRIEREAHYILTNAYGERAVAKNLRRVVAIDTRLSALVDVATTFDFVGVNFAILAHPCTTANQQINAFCASPSQSRARFPLRDVTAADPAY